MTHSPAMHSPHLMRPPKTESVGSSSFTPVSSGNQQQPPPGGGGGVVQDGGAPLVPTPPRPVSSHTPGVASSPHHTTACTPPDSPSPLSSTPGTHADARFKASALSAYIILSSSIPPFVDTGLGRVLSFPLCRHWIRTCPMSSSQTSQQTRYIKTMLI